MSYFELENNEKVNNLSSTEQKCCSRFNIKTIFYRLKFFTVFAVISSYFVYQLIDYFNTSVNISQSLTKETQDSLPKPYVYIEFSSEYDDCLVFRANYSNVNYRDYTSLSSDFVIFDTVHSIDDNSLNDILNILTVDNYYLIKNQSATYIKYLLIPPNYCDETGSKVGQGSSGLHLILFCQLGKYPQIVNDSAFIFGNMDHKNNLYNFDNVTDAFNYFENDSKALIPGLWTFFSYEWDIHDDKIHNEKYEYFIPYIAQQIDIPHTYLDFGIAGVFSFYPVFAAIKETYTISQKTTLIDILSLTGGLFTTVYSALTVMVIYLIWGYGDITKTIKCNGIANESDPSIIEQRRFQPFIYRCYNTFFQKHANIIEKQQRKIESLEDEIKQLKEAISLLQK